MQRWMHSHTQHMPRVLQVRASLHADFSHMLALAQGSGLDVRALHPRLRIAATSVQWGPWRSAGMAMQHASVRQRIERSGVGSIPPATGVHVLQEVLLDIVSQHQVCASPMHACGRAS